MADTIEAPAAPAAPVETPAAPATPPAEAAPTAPVTPPAPKRYKLKVNGAEQDIDGDPIDKAAAALGIDPQELLQVSQLRRASYDRFEQADKARKEAEAKLAAFKADPLSAFKAAGLDAREFAKAQIMAAIEEERRQAEEMNLPEPVRQQLAAARQAQEELARLKAEREQAQHARLEAQKQHYVQKWNIEIPQAMEAAGLPKTVEAAQLVRSKMGAMLRSGVAPDVHQAAKMAAEELSERNFAILRALPPDRIKAAIGEDAYKALLRHSVSEVQGQVPRPQPTPAPQQQPGMRNYMTEREAAKFWTGG